MLLGGEIKKLFGSRYVLIILAILLTGNVALCLIQTPDASSQNSDAYIRAFDDYAADPAGFEEYRNSVKEFQEEESLLILDALLKDEEYTSPERDWKYGGKVDVYQELAIIDAVTARYEKNLSFEDSIKKFIEANRSSLIEFENAGVSKDIYIYRYTEYTVGIYEEMLEKGVKIEFEYSRGWSEYFNYFENGILALLAVSVIVVAVFLGDKSNGSYSIISTTKNGRGSVSAAKLSLVCILSAFVALIFSITGFAVCAIRFGLSSPFNVIQSLDEFYYAPYNCSIIEYFFLLLASRILLCILYALIISVISSAVNNYVYSYAISVGFVGINLFAFLYKTYNVNGFFKVNNFISIWQFTPIFSRVRAYSFFSQPLDIMILLPASFIIISALCIFLTPRIYYRTAYAVRIKLPEISLKLPIKRKVRKDRNLFSFEMYKLVSSVLLDIIIIACVVMSIHSSYTRYEYKESYYSRIYDEYIDKLSGEISSEKLEWIENESKRLIEIISSKQGMTLSYNNGRISEEEYTQFLNKFYDAEGREYVFKYIENHSEYLKKYDQIYGRKLWFTHDSGYNKLFSADVDILLYISILLLFCRIFGIEHMGNNKGGSFYAILCTTKNGRKQSFFYRMLSACILSVLLWLLFVGGEFITYIMNYSLSECSAPLASLSSFENLDSNITIGQYLVLAAFVRLSGCLCLTLIISAFSQLAKRPIPTLFGTFATTMLVHELVLLGVDRLKILDFSSILDCSSLVRFSAENQSKNGGMTVFTLFIFAVFAITFALIYVAYASFTKHNIMKGRTK